MTVLQSYNHYNSKMKINQSQDKPVQVIHALLRKILTKHKVRIDRHTTDAGVP